MLNRNKFLSKMVEAGYTQKTLAEKMNISKNTINAKINGKGYFDTKQVVTICEILHIQSSEEKSEIFLFNPSHNRDETKAS